MYFGLFHLKIIKKKSFEHLLIKKYFNFYGDENFILKMLLVNLWYYLKYYNKYFVFRNIYLYVNIYTSKDI